MATSAIPASANRRGAARLGAPLKQPTIGKLLDDAMVSIERLLSGQLAVAHPESAVESIA